MFDRLFRNAAIRIPVECANKGLQFVFVVYLARTFGPAEFGFYSYALAWGGMFALLMDFGVATVLTQRVAQAQDTQEIHGHLGTALAYKALLVLLSLLAAVVYFAIVPGQSRALLLWLAWAELGFWSLVDMLNGVLRGRQRLGLESAVVSIQRLLAVGLGLAAVWLGRGVGGVLLATLLGNAGGAVAALVALRQIGITLAHVRVQSVTAYARQAIPLGLASVFTLVYFRIDTLLLEHMTDEASVGLYNAAYRVIESLQFLPSVIVGILFPVLAGLYARAPEQFTAALRKAAKFIFLILVPISMTLTLGADLLVDLVYGEGFSPSAHVLRILAWNLPLAGLNFVLIHGLISAQRRGAYTLGTIACAMWNILLNLWAIPRFGYVGSSVTTLATEGLMLAITATAAYRLLGCPAFQGWAVKVVLAAAMAVLVGSLCGQPVLAVAAALGVFAGLVFLLGAISRAEVDALLQGVRGGRRRTAS